MVHPDVQYFPSGWNGYPFWMAVTPYPGSNSAYENPSVYCSHDGLTWVTPSGLSNPVIPRPAAGRYNSDPDLVAGPDGKLYLFYREVVGGVEDDIYVVSSIDGVNWSAPSGVLTGIPAATERVVSPAVVFDGKIWTMYYVDIVSYTVRKRTSAGLTGPWSAPSILQMTAPAAKQFWHLDAVNVAGQVVLLIDVTNIGSNGGGQLYLAWSDDEGVTFTLARNPMLSGTAGWNASIYRSTMVPVREGLDLKLRIWYSAINTTWSLGYTEAVLSGVR